MHEFWVRREIIVDVDRQRRRWRTAPELKFLSGELSAS